MQQLNDIIIEDRPDPAFVAYLDTKVNESNRGTTGPRDCRELAVYIREPGDPDDLDKLLAGLYGWTWGGTCVISLMWVREDLRGNGVGTRLLRVAETEARVRKCRQVLLSAGDFRSPEFYRVRGYSVVDRADDRQSLVLVKGLV